MQAVTTVQRMANFLPQRSNPRSGSIVQSAYRREFRGNQAQVLQSLDLANHIGRHSKRELANGEQNGSLSAGRGEMLPALSTR